jgi:alkylation response protein AidB-like acyl-CoA dehydrogenase
MTLHRLAASPVSDDELGARFALIFEKIAAGAVDRERNRSLPFDEIRLLKEAGFGALRVPKEYGGLGARFVRLSTCSSGWQPPTQIFRRRCGYISTSSKT